MNLTSCRYSRECEWVRVEGEEAVIGITDYAQEQLGAVVYVDLLETGRVLTQGGTFGMVESAKSASDLFAPLSGEVLAVNEALTASLELVNSDPYVGRWMIRMRPSDLAELDTFLDASGYEAYVLTLGQ